MHYDLLEEATHDQLKSFMDEEFNELKESMPRLYKDMEMKLYEHIHGQHFNKRMYECAVKGMKNEDGTTGPHWAFDDIIAVAKSKGVTFNKKYNEYDFAYAMNMIYSDFSEVMSGSNDNFVKMAKAFLEDRDAPEGKAFIYYKAMCGKTQ